MVLTGLDILKSDGLAAVTLSAVGHRLGLLKAGLYTYVKSKEDLLLGMHEEVTRRQLEVLLAAEDLEPEEALKEVCSQWAELSRDYGGVLIAVQPELTSSSLEGGERFLALLGRQGLGTHQQLQVYLLLVSFFDSFVTRSGAGGRSATEVNDRAILEAMRSRTTNLPNMKAIFNGLAIDVRTHMIDDMLSLIIGVIIPALRS